jgi:Pyridoxamine 5'-phosphate oxidase
MTDVTEELAKPFAQQVLREVPTLSLSYVGRDGGPRGIPIAYLWDGDRFRMWTIPGSAKVAALRADQRVALSVDVRGFPPKLLLVRGRAELTDVDGVPDGYLEASHRTMPREGWSEFDAQVRALYESMVALTVSPTWARMIDFETTLPRAVERAAARAR